ncbi:hypothetical protein DW077_19075, partial [Phocaeicola vulgatus]
ELYDRIKSVAIFGHSLGETDHTYFNKLFQESCMYNNKNIRHLIFLNYMTE